MSALSDAFTALLRRNGVPAERVQALWEEVVSAYSARGRHYHTLHHIEDVHARIAEAPGGPEAPDALLLATVYHDLVLRAGRSDNEARSAHRMRERLGGLLPASMLERAARHILATRHHGASADRDTDLFTDADLSILGSPPVEYGCYAQAIRREFKRYPDVLYKPGRQNVLTRFLAMPQLFKSRYFSERFERQARLNLQAELNGL